MSVCLEKVDFNETLQKLGVGNKSTLEETKRRNGLTLRKAPRPFTFLPPLKRCFFSPLCLITQEQNYQLSGADVPLWSAGAPGVDNIHLSALQLAATTEPQRSISMRRTVLE